MSTPDQLLCARLGATAQRLAAEQGNIQQAADQLHELAGGRRDLLTKEAGMLGGAWSADPSGRWDHALAAGLIICAGVDLPQLWPWVNLARRNVLQPRWGQIYKRPRYE